MAETIDHATMQLYDEGKADVRAYVERVLWSEQGIYLASLIGPGSAVKALLAALAAGKGVTVEEHKGGRPVDTHYLQAAGKGKLFTSRLRDGYTHGAFVARACLVEHKGEEERELVVLDEDPARILAHLTGRVTLTVLSEWAPWLVERMREEGLLYRLEGMGVIGSVVRPDEGRLDELISRGVREGAIAF